MKLLLRHTFLFCFFVLISFSKGSLRGFPGGASGKETACQCGRHKRLR